MNDPTEEDITVFERGYKNMAQIPQLYGSPKVHKDWTNQGPLQLVNSQIGSLSAFASKYIDYYLKKLVPFIPGIVKDSLDVIKRLNQINFNQPHV